MSGAGAIACYPCPAVICELYFISAFRCHWFQSNHRSFDELWARSSAAPIGDFRVFVDGPTDTVSYKLAYDAKTLFFQVFLYRVAYIAYVDTGAYLCDSHL